MHIKTPVSLVNIIPILSMDSGWLMAKTDLGQEVVQVPDMYKSIQILKSIRFNSPNLESNWVESAWIETWVRIEPESNLYGGK